jgi:Flp pilus assembly protein TadD/TolB-like protein
MLETRGKLMYCPVCGRERTGVGSTCAGCGANLGDSSSDTATSPSNRPSRLLGFAPGESFGNRYTIVERIGVGGQADVYKALDERLNRTVALKLIAPTFAENKKHLERFKRELALAQEVSHPNVCHLHDIGEVEGVHYISMEFIDGQTLNDWVQAVGNLSPQQTVSVAEQICSGLAAIHAQSIVHRDLKPQNVMLDRSGRVVMMDFGLAYRPEVEPLTASGEALGTLAYLSPEQARGERVDPRADIYALGLVLYEMLTGRRPPGDGKSLPLALRDSSERCPPPSEHSPQVPRRLDEVVMHCLERDPAKRYQSVAELQASLGRVEDSLSSKKPRPPLVPASRRKRIAALGAIAAAFVAVVAVLLVLSPPSGEAVVTLAIQPFRYEGPDENSYLGDYVPVALGRALRDVEGLEVVPFDTSRHFDPTESARSVARQLGVHRIVQGAIRTRGRSYEGDVTIYDEDGNETWSESVSGTTASLFDGTDRMAESVAASLGASLDRDDLALPDPRSLEKYMEGKRYLEGWDVEENDELAVDAFAEAAQDDPAFAEAHAGLARALWKQYEATRETGLVERAVSAARRAVELGPDLPEAHLAMGEVQLGRGQSAEAIASFRTAQELAPADDAVCRRIGDAYAARGREELAERMYRRAVTLRPGYWENYNYLGSFRLKQGRFAEAERQFREVIRLRPESDTGYTNLATTLVLSGKLEEAEPLLLAALRLNPTAIAHNNLGFIYYSQRRFRESEARFQAAAELNPDFALYHSNLGDALRQLGRSGEARRAYLRAIELFRERVDVNPDDSETRAELSMALAGYGDCEQALGQAELLESRSDLAPTEHYYLALAYELCEEGTKAREHAESASAGGIDVTQSPDLESFSSHRR